ncbi:hypothetical protein [Neptunomonas marina]|uniref:Terminase large subunit gp17-like C-terminal domain-containing protein n=1 Tax=Neptunomonas marina TaxID=1815562 RepID=A0A437QDW3_9GAMM|nr:hypothetical protein [Neptunomonas marina]RVU32711.1 hypothetical protein EOE65_03385 [Neptunomonas marina]
MSRAVIQAGWDDVPHISDEMIERMTKGMAPHTADARRKGIPSLGSGAIYPIPEEEVFIDPIQLPDYFHRAYGLDVGWKKTAAIWGAIDRDSDIIYCYSEHYRGYAEPSVHASGIRARGAWIPGNIDYAGTNQSDGQRIMELYENEDLNLIRAEKAVEAGLLEVLQRLSTGRLKIFKTLTNTASEYRIYRRDEKGKVVKKNDHAMDALRYLVMGIEHAITKPVETTFSRPAVGDSVAGY